MTDSVKAALDAYLPGGAGRCFVAFSGGLDSTVLLHAVNRHRPGQVTALHINHRMHPDADAWERDCQRFCDRWGIPLRCRRVKVLPSGEGWEAAARAARYRCFEESLGDADHLLLAHHLDDQVETLFLRLLRGAGLEGLAGMPQRRPLGAGFLLRPFLSLPRSSLADYAREQCLSWVDDPSNTDTRMDRNYLRQQVLPLLEARWPAYRRTAARAALRLADAAEGLSQVLLESCDSVIGDPGFALHGLPSPPLDATAIRNWLRGLGLRPPPAARLTSFLHQLHHAAGAQLSADGWVLERYRDAVFCRNAAPAPASGPLPITPGQTLLIDGVGRVRLRPQPARLAAPALPLQLRFRRGGERIRLGCGHHGRLKTLLQDRAVPPWWRDRLPLLFAGEELLVVGPLCRAPRAVEAALELDWEPSVFVPPTAPPGALRSAAR